MEEAYAEIAKNLNKIKAESGADSVAFVSGFSKWYRPIFKRFAYAFGSINYATESSCCFDSMVMPGKPRPVCFPCRMWRMQRCFWDGR